MLYRHPAVLEAAVVARPDDEMGRDALRLRHAEGRRQRRPRPEIIAFCREHMAHFKAPRTVVFGPLPEDLDRQDPEIRAAGAGEGSSLKGDRIVTGSNPPMQRSY